MNSLNIEANKYGLRVYCTKCKRYYSNKNIKTCYYRGKDKNLKYGDKSKCDSLDNQSYKSVVSDREGSRVKTFPTKDYEEALIHAIEFKAMVKNGVLDAVPDNPYEVEVTSLSLLDAANLFLNYQNDVEVPSHLKKNLSKDHLDHIKSKLIQFLDILDDNGFNRNTMPVIELKDHHVGLWYEYITTNYGQGSWNTLRRIMSSWINYLIDEQGLDMKNPFSKVTFEIIECDIEAISEVEFNGVLDAIDTKSPYKQIGGKRPQRINMKKPYLKDGIRLGLMTGLRREEVVTLDWSDIKIQSDTGKLIIVTDNLKVERIMKKKYKKKYVAVYPQLMELLVEMGYNDLKESDEYILHPERGTLKAKTMMTALSKGFSHYFKQAFPDKKPMQFKVLRKTYMSYLNKAVGDDMIDLSGHGDMDVVKKHYLDKNLTARGGDMRMF